MTDQRKTRAQLLEELRQLTKRNRELEKMTRELRENEKLLRCISENYPNSYLSIIEPDFTVGYTAGGEFKKNGLNPQHFMGLTLEQVFGEKTALIREHYEKTFAGEERNFELHLNGQHQLYHTVPLFSDDGTVNRILVVVQNITPLKEKERELRQAFEEVVELKEKAEETNLLKSRFLANMSHDVRVPLNAILGFTDLLLKHENRTKQMEYLEKIKIAGQGLSNLINDILDLSKIEAGRLTLFQERFRIMDLLDGLVVLFEVPFREKGLAFETRVTDRVPEIVYNDMWRMNQVLTNLLSNALKFTDDGWVRVEADYVAENDLLVFHVRDSGNGIDERQQEKIFEPFTQIESVQSFAKQGAGLGLAICRKLLQLMEGNITVSSTPGEGTAFRLEIPANSGSVNDVTEVGGRPVPLGTVNEHIKEKKILIVEDNPVNLEVLREQFREEGYHNLVWAWNGKEAVEAALKHNPDLILMDIQMPVMDGNEAIARLKEKGFPKPIVVLSAYAMREDFERSLALGAVDYISKPIDFSTFFERIAFYLQPGDGNSAANQRLETKPVTRAAAHRYKVDPAVSERVKTVFLRDVSANITAINGIIVDGTTAEGRARLRKIAHNYKGNLNYFGLEEFVPVAFNLEKAILHDEPRQRIEALAGTLAAVLEEILSQNGVGTAL